MTQSQPSYYAIIPAKVRYCKNLMANAKLLYGEITALCNQNGYCWATNKYFSDLYEVDERNIRKWIESLKDEGFIDVDFDNQTSQRKIKIIDGADAGRPGRTKTSGGQDENVRGSHIYLNNTSNNTLSPPTPSPQKEPEKENVFSSNDKEPKKVPPEKSIAKNPVSQQIPERVDQLSSYLLQCIRNHHPRFQGPDSFNEWNSIFKSLLLSNRTNFAELKKIIEWSTKDNHWKPIILSPTDIGRNLDRLIAKVNQTKVISLQDQIRKDFKNYEKYNDAVCYITEDLFAFQRGIHQKQIRWNSKTFKEDALSLIHEFGIDYKVPD